MQGHNGTMGAIGVGGRSGGGRGEGEGGEGGGVRCEYMTDNLEIFTIKVYGIDNIQG